MICLDLYFKTKYTRPNGTTCVKPAIPLSKTSSASSANISNSIRYSQLVKGTTQWSSSSIKPRNPNSLGGPTYKY